MAVEDPPPGQPTSPSSKVTGLGRTLENVFERALFSSRLLLAPFFAGLALSVLILLIKFAMELVHLASVSLTEPVPKVVAETLGLVDLSLTASLLIIVVFSGYQNFVSRIDHAAHHDWPRWMGTVDFTGLKLKLLSSIVAISAVQLLRVFLAIDTISDRELWWTLSIHLIFVVSTLLLALSDKIMGHSE